MAEDRPKRAPGEGLDARTLAGYTDLAREGASAELTELNERIVASEARGETAEMWRLQRLAERRRSQWVLLVLALVVILIVLLALWATRGPADGAAGGAASSAASTGDAGTAEQETAEETGPAEEVDSAEPGPPYLDGRHFAIVSLSEGQEKRVYTLELIGEGDTGTIRVWEDETGEGTFVIDGQSIRIDMTRMVPPEDHRIREPNVFEGVLSTDGSRIEGTWTTEGWFADPDGAELSGEWWTVPVRADRL